MRMGVMRMGVMSVGVMRVGVSVTLMKAFAVVRTSL